MKIFKVVLSLVLLSNLQVLASCYDESYDASDDDSEKGNYRVTHNRCCKDCDLKSLLTISDLSTNSTIYSTTLSVFSNSNLSIAQDFKFQHKKQKTEQKAKDLVNIDLKSAFEFYPKTIEIRDLRAKMKKIG